MERFFSWFRVVLTWVVILPDIFLSYIYLRNPIPYYEALSLILNVFATTVLFYIYMDINKESKKCDIDGEEGKSKTDTEAKTPDIFIYKLVFGSLIEDMLVWFGLFFLLYNIVPVTLYVHNLVLKNL